MKADNNKHKIRATYIVKEADENLVTLIKLVHSNDPGQKTKLGSKDVEVKQEDIYIAEVHSNPSKTKEERYDEESDGSESYENEECFIKNDWKPFNVYQESSSGDEMEEPSATFESIGSHDDREYIEEHDQEISASTDTLDYSDQRTPKKNDRIEFYSLKKDDWIQVTLTSHGIKRLGGVYYNYVCTDGSKGSVKLEKRKSWRHVDVQSRQLNVTPAIHNPLNAPFPCVVNLNDIFPLSTSSNDAGVGHVLRPEEDDTF